MPIQAEALEAPENLHLAVHGHATLRQALALLISPDVDGGPWWHLVVLRSNGTWAAARFAELYLAAVDDHGKLEVSLGELELLTPVRSVEGDALSTVAAANLAKNSPGKLVVVTEDGKPCGILCGRSPQADKGFVHLMVPWIRDLVGDVDLTMLRHLLVEKALPEPARSLTGTCGAGLKQTEPAPADGLYDDENDSDPDYPIDDPDVPDGSLSAHHAVVPGDGDGGPPRGIPARPPADVERRHTDIACPRQVWRETPRFTVVVRLTVRRPELGPATEAVEVLTDQPVQVAIEAGPAFEILNQPRQEIVVPPGRDSPAVVFDLRPLREGHHPLSIDLFQTGDHLGTVSWSVEVVRESVTEVKTKFSTHLPPREPEVEAPDIVLRIVYDSATDNLTLSLIRDGGASWQDFRAVPLKSAPERFVDELLRGVTVLTEGADPSTAAVLGKRRVLAMEDIDRRLKALGQNLWDRLFPQDFKRLYARERADWRARTLLILSDEPFVPWELIWPYGDDWEDEEPWCLSLRMSRWLRRDTEGNGNARSPGRLPLGSLACLAPGDSNLPAARAEIAFLKELVKQYELDDASPSRSSSGAVMDLLETGGYDWLHVAAHGSFYPAAPDQHGALWLDGQIALAPEHIVGAAIERHLRRTRPAFLFNACHAGRLGWSLTGLGGWANRLLSRGAGMFLGPLWAVRDDSALVMARNLYDELLAGETIAEACRRARRAARRPGDPTWLAYSLYAHPNARLKER